MITQLSSSGGWNFGEIYAAGKHIATYSGSTTNFMHGDWLRTKRAMTAVNGTISETCTGFWFGDGVNCTGTNWSFNGFTDDIHDRETNLEHTLFRQYSGSQGRWLSPDPAGIASADPTNPQSWNRYAYVLNNPVNAIDPSGLYGDCAFYHEEEGDICLDNLDDLVGIGGSPVNTVKTGIFNWIQHLFEAAFSCDDNDCGVEAAEAGWAMNMRFLNQFLAGQGGEQNYGPLDPHTQNFQRSMSAANILEDLANHCSSPQSPTTGPDARGLSTPKAASRLPADVFMSPVAAQVGAFNYQWQQQGSTATITVTNYATANSLLYHAMSLANTLVENAPMMTPMGMPGSGEGTGARPIPEQWSTGPMATIKQTFTYSVPNPYSQK